MVSTLGEFCGRDSTALRRKSYTWRSHSFSRVRTPSITMKKNSCLPPNGARSYKNERTPTPNLKSNSRDSANRTCKKKKKKQIHVLRYRKSETWWRSLSTHINHANVTEIFLLTHAYHSTAVPTLEMVIHFPSVRIALRADGTTYTNNNR